MRKQTDEAKGKSRGATGTNHSMGRRLRDRVSGPRSTECDACKAMLEEGLELSGRPGDARAAIAYRGVVEGQDDRREWDHVREDDVLRSHSASEIARLFSPFGSAERLAILFSLYRSEKTGQALCEETGLTQGQLYHHVKDLIYLGYVRQRGRNRYDITLKGRQALLTMVLMADDFARH